MSTSSQVEQVGYGKETARRAFLVELKTDMASRGEEQAKDLGQAVKVGLKKLILGVTCICFSTNQKSKYVHLLHLLHELKLPIEYDTSIFPVKQGYSETLRSIRDKVERTRSSDWTSLDLVYVQPNNDIIDFNEFAKTIREREDDGIRHTFACYLEEGTKLPETDRRRLAPIEVSCP